MRDVGEVSVVAPDRDQSGIGTGMTLLSVVRLQEFQSPLDGVAAFSVQGTPADAVVLALRSLFEEEPFDLVVSGINQGANLGMDYLVSGTVGAALQGYLHGVPSVALSVKYPPDIRYDGACLVGTALARAISLDRSQAPFLINVNVPGLPPADIRRVELTTPGPVAYYPTVEAGQDGRRTHYWIRHIRPTDDSPPEGTDVWALRNDAVSITPIHTAPGDGVDRGSLRAFADAVRSALGTD